MTQNLCFGQTPCPIPDFQSYSCEDCPSYITAKSEPIVKAEFIYFKNDVRALELAHKVTDLENSNSYLLKKVKELTASASKRKSKYV